jgi:signal peptidase I
MDFALLLFLLLCVTGVLWAFDRFLWEKKRQQAIADNIKSGLSREEAVKRNKQPLIIEYARAFFPVILIVFLLRSFLVEPFKIPSGSMYPSLYVGDYILVNKFAYGVRLPIIHVKMIDVASPRRGEVAVFRYPADPSVNYIKRVVGLPGDRVLYKDKQLYINGEPMAQSDEQPYVLHQGHGVVERFIQRHETLGDVQHPIIVTDRPEVGPREFIVKTGHYFVMGDNRDNSNDSRSWGLVPEDNLVGRAFFIWFSVNEYDNGGWFWQRIVWKRIGTTIQ